MQLRPIADYGFKGRDSGSFRDVHYNNELNNGMLPIVQPRGLEKLPSSNRLTR